MSVNTNKQKIHELLTRGVAEIYPTKEALEKLLLSGKCIRLYMGIDPTAPHLHIGHALQLRKLHQFQDLGHEVILLIGSFTGMIGDPTDKTAARQKLTRAQVMANAKTYKKQASKILSFTGANAVKLKYNHTWLAKLNFEDVTELASYFTAQQMFERDMFEKRLYGELFCSACNEYFALKPSVLKLTEDSTDFDKKGWAICPKCHKLTPLMNVKIGPQGRIIQPKPIYIHEFLYPLMQGYDSVAMDVDVEIGGTDQTFNMLAGRTLMKAMKNKEKFVMTLKLLTNDEGKKMSKSEGGFIALDDTPEEMFGKLMAMDDSMIIPYFELATDVPMGEIEKKRNVLVHGTNPRDVKMELARVVVAMYHGERAAEKAETQFVKTFQKKEQPSDMSTVKARGTIVDVLVAAKLAGSKSDARRLIAQGGVKIDDVVVTDVDMLVKRGTVIQKGKRYFVRIG